MALQLALLTIAAPGSSSAAGCPNEAIRTQEGSTYLPDCRAYEMVSPVEKHGVDVSHNNSVESSSNGDAAVFSSLGGFADSASASLLSSYRAERTPGGWLTHGFSPAVAPNGINILTTYLMAVSPDLSKAILRSRPAPPGVPGTQPNAVDFYKRDIPFGSFENLTPIVPEPEFFNQEGGGSIFSGANDDLSVVGMTSPQQLTPEAPGGEVPNAFVWEGGQLHYVGFFPDESTASSGGSFIGSICCLENRNAISADGSQVVFQAQQPGDARSVYLREDLSSTVEASASQRTPLDPAGPKAAEFQGASVTGDKVFFITEEELLNSDTDSSRDLYVFEPQSSQLRRISIDAEPADGSDAAAVRVLAAGEDGNTVYFAARGALVSGQPATTGMKLYRWHEDGSPNGSLAYIATLDEALDAIDWDPQIFNERPHAQASPDGRYFVFASRTQLGAFQNAGHAEIYRYDSLPETVDCVSCRPDEAEATGDAALYGMNASPVPGIDDSGFRSRNVLDDGRVFFETEDSLTPLDGNGKVDVYEWSAGSPSLISSGVSPADSHFGNADPNGRNVFFLTRDPLVGIDVDANFDLYSARSEGGLSAQNPVPELPCSAETCRLPSPPPPAGLNPATATLAGTGNVKPRRHRAKHHRRHRHKKRHARRNHHRHGSGVVRGG